ncbi:MAG: hypothetical protein AAF685_14230 [Cyanobacteria bacterium P01_C01_bin.89]
MNEPTFKSGSSGRNPLLEPILLVPVMALTLGVVAAWRYWDNPNAFSGSSEEGQNGFEDLLAEFEASQRSPEALAADIDSSQVLSGELRSLGGIEGQQRNRNRDRNKKDSEPKAKSSEDILKLLNNVSKSPTGGGARQALPATSIFNSSSGSRLSLGQFQPDGSFQGRGLSLAPVERGLSLAPAERALARNAALGRFQSLQPGQAGIGGAQGQAELPMNARQGTFDGSVPGAGVPGTVGRSSPLSPAVATPGYGANRPIPGAGVGVTGEVPSYGSAPVGQPRTYTTPGYGVAPTVPSVAGSGPLVPSTSGPGYSRGLRNYQLNTAPPPNAGLSTGAVGGNRPLRSQTGAGALDQPQPTPSSNIGGRNFSSFSNPYGR